jgi:hypothetical protein
LATASHFPSRRKGRAAAPHQLRVDDLTDHRLGADLDRAPKRLEAAARAVAGDARRIDRVDSTKQAQVRIRLGRFRLRQTQCLRLRHHGSASATSHCIAYMPDDRIARGRPDVLCASTSAA